VAWPGAVSSPTPTAAKVKTLPARTPSTRLIMPCSPMQSRRWNDCQLRAQKLDHGNVVEESGRGADHFVEVGGKARIFSRVSSSFFVPGSRGRKEAGRTEYATFVTALACTSVQSGVRRPPVGSRGRRFGQNVELGGNGAANLPPLAARGRWR